MYRMIAFIVMLSMSIVVTAQTSPTVSPALEASLMGLEEFTARVRGLEVLEPVTRYFPSRAELRAFIDTQINEELTDEAVDKALRFYVAFGFLPAETDLRATLINFYGGQVGGYYDPETKEMNTVLLQENATLGDGLPILERITYVHEFTHALQDQHFDLLPYLLESETLGLDERLARLSLVEGDASLTMTAYVQTEAQRDPLGVSLGMLLGGITTGTLTLPPGIPSIIANELLFPYETGLTFVQALYRETGSWERVNEAFASPPTTSEQILHPEKYLAGEGALPIGLDILPIDGWQLVEDGTVGQFYLNQFLGQYLSPSDALAASQGWGGDAFQIYEDDAGNLAMRYAVVADTALDMIELKQAFALVMEAYTKEKALETGYVVEMSEVRGIVMIVFAPNMAVLAQMLP